jgi:hypothetical protein
MSGITTYLLKITLNLNVLSSPTKNTAWKTELKNKTPRVQEMYFISKEKAGLK